MAKIDMIDKLYLPSKIMAFLQKGIFVLNIILAVGALIFKGKMLEIILFLQSLVVILGFTISIIDDAFCWYEAEKGHRRDCLQNAFSVQLAVNRTEGYYNNNLPPSVERYALNQFESVFYSINVLKHMLFPSIIKTIILLCILFITACYAENYGVVLLIAQTVFSTTFVLETVMLIAYRSRLTNVYDEFYMQFITLGVGSETQKVILLASCIEYETIKAYFKIRLDSKKFDKLHAILDEQWKELLQQIVN